MPAGDAPTPFAFAAGALDRAGELREDAVALARHWSDPAARVLTLSRDGRALVALDGVRLARRAPHASEPELLRTASFLGLENGAALFLEIREARDDDAGHGAFLDLRRIAAQLPAGEAALAAYARALAHWQSRKRYCGRCGAATRFAAAGHRATCSDSTCGQEYFPRTDPAIIVLVTHGRRCLLGRQPSWPERRFSTLAGFVEPGETLEQAVAREVFEEAGVRVAASRYVAAQPWPFPASLMLGFVAETPDQHVQVGSELAEARWFDADTMAGEIAAGSLIVSPAISIAFHLLDGWYHGLMGRHLQPGPGFGMR